MKLLRYCMWAVLALTATAAFAQSYPARPVKLVIPSAPGGTSDFVGRTIAGKLSEYLGQPIVIENRPGAGDTIGTETVAKAAPDGYTLLLIAPSFTANPALYPKLPYDSMKDFAPVAQVLSYPYVLVASASLPASSVQDVIALAKANPGRIRYASGGSGGGNHLAGEMFKWLTSVQLGHVPYQGNGPALTDLLGDRVQLMFTVMPPVEAQIKAGKLKALAVTGPKRIASAPDVPTMLEAGVPDFDVMSWYGVLAPWGTPKSVIERLNADLRKTMQNPEVRDKLVASLGGDTAVSSPETFGAMLRREFALWARLVREMNIKVE